MHVPQIRNIRLDLLAAAAFFIVLGWVFTHYGGGPQGSDVLAYVEAGNKHIADPLLLNRYVHIYLQQAFIFFSPHLITGLRVFWAFLVCGIGFLIYYNARTLSPHNTFLHGILAVMFFLSLPFLSTEPGSPQVDTSAMFMVCVVVTLYLLSYRREHRNRWLLIALGCAFFLAFKTKETTLFSGILFLGLALNAQGQIDLALFKKRLALLLAGILAGILVLIGLNILNQNQPLFGLRPSDFRAFSNNYASTTAYHTNPKNWYTHFLLNNNVWVLFLLFLLSGVKASSERSERFPLSVRLVWVIPFLLLAFLTLTMIRGNWGIIQRYFYPAFPLLCLLAPQFIDFKCSSRREWLTTGLSFLAGLALVVLLRFFLVRFALTVDWNFSNFLETIIYPLTVTIIFVAAILIERYNSRTVILPALAILVLTFYPIQSNYKTVVVERVPQKSFESRVAIWAPFKHQVQVTPDMHFYVSKDLARNMQIKVNRDELFTLFNVYFDAKTRRDNFTFSDPAQPASADLLANPYDYALLTLEDWNAALAFTADAAQIQTQYTITQEPTQGLVFLKRKR